MARRIDYYDDPDAPTVNSMVASVNVVVTNSAGEVLLIRRSDNDNWAVPGGAIDLGESVMQAAVRETREETGIECEITGLVGTYTDPRHVMLYTSNGEVRQEFSIVLTGRAQSPSAPVSFRGRVVAADSGTPLRHARIQATTAKQTLPPVFTDGASTRPVNGGRVTRGPEPSVSL